VLVLDLPWPPTTNTYYRNHRGKMLISKRGRDYATQVKAAFWQTHGLRKPITGDVQIRIYLSPPDARRRDLDNVAGKALLDALSKAGVWEDDCQVRRLYAEFLPVEPGGACRVEIEELRPRCAHS
jgi:crossover junction endodeoxyribonuclease RusA